MFNGGSVYYTDENGIEASISRYADNMIDRRNGDALSGRVIDAQHAGAISRMAPAAFFYRKKNRFLSE